MHENRQTFTVDHQPRYNLAKLLRSKHRLIHPFEMRTDGLLVPASKLDAESSPQPFTHPRRRIFCVQIIIDMGVVALDFPFAHKAPLPPSVVLFLSNLY